MVDVSIERTTGGGRRAQVAPRRRLGGLAALVVLVATAAWAQDEPLPACGAGLPPHVTLADPTWRTVVVAPHGFALQVPPSHALAGADTSWYVHGFLDGAPLVPDVALTLMASVTIDEALAHDAAAGADVERVRLGPATSGVRVVATYSTPDGTSYRASHYLAELRGAVLRIDRYEGFDWDGFDALACSVQAVEIAD